MFAQLLKELDYGNVIFYTKEEIKNCLLPDFKVIGRLSEKLKEELLILTNGTIYVVKLLPTHFCFCNSNGKVIYNMFFL